jgi:hypothetical protein
VIRTLAIIAVMGFVMAFGCLASAFAIAGGPFSIDDNFNFHRASFIDVAPDKDLPRGLDVSLSL